ARARARAGDRAGRTTRPGGARRVAARLLLGLRLDGGRGGAEAGVPVLAAQGAAVEAALRAPDGGVSRGHPRGGGGRRDRAVPSGLRAAAGGDHRGTGAAPVSSPAPRS